MDSTEFAEAVQCSAPIRHLVLIRQAIAATCRVDIGDVQPESRLCELANIRVDGWDNVAFILELRMLSRGSGSIGRLPSAAALENPFLPRWRMRSVDEWIALAYPSLVAVLLSDVDRDNGDPQVIDDL